MFTTDHGDRGDWSIAQSPLQNQLLYSYFKLVLKRKVKSILPIYSDMVMKVKSLLVLKAKSDNPTPSITAYS